MNRGIWSIYNMYVLQVRKNKITFSQRNFKRKPNSLSTYNMYY